jgi:DNA-directed RNA polymerase specialized sigma24 family protein
LEKSNWLAQCFEAHRARLRGIAFRMLGSLADADDAVQETWLRLSRSQTGEVENLGGSFASMASTTSCTGHPLPARASQ